ncbi:MAG: Smr/MutS family protein [Deferribacteraceae bacterium]|nr:Smr/MutS family protein [Deferribacteraceae bacterium]
MTNNINLETLEFPLFCQALRQKFVSSFAAERMASLLPKRSMGEAIAFQNDLKCLFDLYNSMQAFALENDNAFYELYARINAEDARFISLEPLDYLALRQFIRQLLALKAHLGARKQLERLSGVISRIQPDEALAASIDRTFDDDGSIKDSATPELRAVRSNIREIKRKAQNILQAMSARANADKFIQENVVVLRHGRYTIPCKTNFAQYIDGIIHDRSASGQTVYVEPSSCVPLNNELQESIIAESEEIARILAALLLSFTESLPTLEQTVDSYGYMAFLIEIWQFYSRYDYVFPEFGDEIRFQSVHHPLLLLGKNRDSIPLDLSLSAEQNLIVISGPNTGGKTASLKSVGLNHIIGMCGLPLFGAKAMLIFLDQIKADIGDHQSLVMDLSTFSAHMTNINSIISNINGRSLLLFDELGTGTDPREGAALAIAVLEYARQHGSKILLTTHFAEMKAYAFERADAKMYAVDFDYETFIPTYRLLEGVAGRSAPIIIAERLGFPAALIEDASTRASAMKSSTQAALEEINLMRAETEHTKRVLAEREAELAEREAKYASASTELKEKLSKRELDLLEETMALLQRGKRLADNRLKAAPEQIAEDIKQVSEKIQEIKAQQKPVTDLKLGDLIFLEKYSKIAKVLALDGKFVQVDLEGIKVKINRQDLIGKKIEDKKPQQVKVSAQNSADSRSELVLVGKRVEEALDILDKQIDNAQLAGLGKLYVVHGRGSGQLRKAIHEYLRSTGRVKHFAIASAEEGGNAVTIVEP